MPRDKAMCRHRPFPSIRAASARFGKEFPDRDRPDRLCPTHKRGKSSGSSACFPEAIPGTSRHLSDQNSLCLYLISRREKKKLTEKFVFSKAALRIGIDSLYAFPAHGGAGFRSFTFPHTCCWRWPKRPSVFSHPGPLIRQNQFRSSRRRAAYPYRP